MATMNVLHEKDLLEIYHVLRTVINVTDVAERLAQDFNVPSDEVEQIIFNVYWKLRIEMMNDDTSTIMMMNNRLKPFTR